MEDAFAQADQLVELITTSVARIKDVYRNSSQTLPTLDTPDDTTAPLSPDFRNSLRVLQGACSQLTTLLSPPAETIVVAAWSHYTAACLNTVVTAKVAEHLKDKPNGLHTSELASLTKIDENKLERALRLLASKHCFTEVASNTFANNRLSVTLLSDVGAFVNFLTDEAYYAGSALTDTLLDPELTSSTVASQAAFGRSMRYDGTLWDWHRGVSPEKSQRFGRGMVGYASMLSYDTILNGFPWSKEPAGTVICDVAGGTGHISLHIAKNCPQNRFSVVVQDLPPVIDQAKIFWNSNAPDLVKEGRVRFVPFDFFKDDAVLDCDIYYIKNILHDWPDSDCKTIMSHVRKAMKPTSRLVIQDILIQHVSYDHNDKHFIKTAQKPLLPNYGEGNIFHYYCDVCMTALLNGKERTLKEFIALGNDCGLQLVGVWDCGQQKCLEFKVEGGTDGTGSTVS